MSINRQNIYTPKATKGGAVDVFVLQRPTVWHT